jgi:hypothetical protein
MRWWRCWCNLPPNLARIEVKSMAQKDKRGSPRFKPKPGTHIVYIEGSAAIKDLSLEGMYVLDPEPLPVGSKIKFALRLGTDDIQLQGIVTRSAAFHGMMIQFADIAPEAKRRLRIHLAGLGPASEEPRKS